MDDVLLSVLLNKRVATLDNFKEDQKEQTPTRFKLYPA